MLSHWPWDTGKKEIFSYGEKKGNKVVWSQKESRTGPPAALALGDCENMRSALSSRDMHSGFCYNSLFSLKTCQNFSFEVELSNIFYSSNWLFEVALEESRHTCYWNARKWEKRHKIISCPLLTMLDCLYKSLKSSCIFNWNSACARVSQWGILYSM